MRLAKKRRVDLVPYLFIAPQLILFAIFFILPAIIGIVAAFSKWNIYTDSAPIFNGLSNFEQILFDSETSYYTMFRNGMGNTLLFVVISVPLCILLPLFMAIVLSQKPIGHKFFQALYYLPNIFSISTVILVWFYVFNRSDGLANNSLSAILGQTVNLNWLGTQPFAWVAITIVTVWWCLGGNLVIYLAAINGVSADLLEAAQIDGAGLPTRMWKIVLPSIRPQLSYTIVLTTISQFNIYGQSLMLTSGGPDSSTYTMMMYIRQLAFGSSSVAGIAASMALMFGIVMIITSTVLNRVTAQRD
ncbi:MAG: sugar ABC transporter permease [Firmicutes bacterium]|nr:sugar ABC transporter permease [Bacillota bacterium]